MVENWDQQDKRPEIMDNQSKTNQQESTIEDALKKKLPDNTDKQQFFLNILKNPRVSEVFTQKDIINYIEGRELVGYSRTLKTESPAEQVKIIMGNIDLYFKNNWWIKTIQVYKTKNKNETEANIEKKDTLLEARKATQESYNALDKKYKAKEEDKDKVEAIKNNFSPETKKALEEKWLEVNAYANFIFTKDTYWEVLKKENNTAFLDDLEKLDKILPRQITTLANTSNPNHTDLIVENNKSLRDFTETSDKFGKISAPTLPEIKNFDTEFARYVKFIPDETIRKNIEKNKDIIKEFKSIYDKDQEDARNEKWEKAYKEYMSAIAQVKENLPKRTETIIRQRALGSCITGLARYFDTTTLAPSSAGMNKENFADDFDINTQEGFQVQKGKWINEQNDDILYINGKIKGNSIGFYYNLTNPDAQLQSDDFLNFNGVSETFAFGKNTEGLSASGGKNTLGIQLPTIGTLSTQAQGVSERKFSTLLEKSTSLEDFESSFKDTISNELLKNYGQEVIVKSRVERDIEKNIVTQTLHSTFIPDVVATEMSKEATNKINNKIARKLLEIRDKSTENMGASELRRLRSLIQRLDPLIAKEKHKNLEPKRQRLLKGMANDRTSVDYNDERGTKTLKFFRRFSEDSQINLDDIERFVTDVEKEESIAENITGFSPEFQTIEEKEQADGLLEKI